METYIYIYAFGRTFDLKQLSNICEIWETKPPFHGILTGVSKAAFIFSHYSINHRDFILTENHLENFKAFFVEQLIILFYLFIYLFKLQPFWFDKLTC